MTEPDRAGPTRRVAPGRRRWGPLAAAWALLFAALHIFWALDGSWLLASSAGTRLADERPAWFVALGLYGVATVLVVAVAFAMALARQRLGRRTAGVGAALSVLVGVVLLLRGVGVEVPLLTDAGGVATAVGPAQTRLTLAPWNPGSRSAARSSSRPGCRQGGMRG